MSIGSRAKNSFETSRQHKHSRYITGHNSDAAESDHNLLC